MAFRTKKISQMDPKGSNLASTDLLEISQLVSGSYVTKSITGAQIAASAPAAAWGTITGTLSAQTDLNTALSGKVPTTRTLTINGTTQDLSADRTFTVSTGITIGTTAITSGTVGRVLFEGTGNVVQESANLFWDNTNGRLGIGTSTPFWGLHYNTNGALNVGMFSSFGNTNTFESMLYLLRGRGTQSLPSAILSGDNLGSLRMAGQYSSTVGQYNTGAKIEGVATENWSASANGTYLGFHTTAIGSNSILERMRIASTGNLLINTTTDAGFKLDVNGTARVSGNTFLASTYVSASGSQFGVGTSSINAYYKAGISGNIGTTGLIVLSSDISGSGTPVYLQRTASLFNVFSTLPITFSVDSERMRIFGTTGNVGIGTTTDVASSILTLQSTTKGFLPPRMTTTEKNAIATPATGLMVYDTTLNLISVYNGTTWISL